MNVYFKVYRWHTADSRPARRFDDEQEAVAYYNSIDQARQPSIVRITEEEFVPSPAGDPA